MPIPIPPEVRKHAGDAEWLEEHGEQAMADYMALYDSGMQAAAEGIFARSMGLLRDGPAWWRRKVNESFEGLKADLAEALPGHSLTWGGRKADGTESDLKPDPQKTQPGSIDEATSVHLGPEQTA